MGAFAGTQRFGNASQTQRSKFTAALVAASAIVALYAGRAVFIPLSLAVLIAFALAPVVSGLRRLKLGRVPSVVASIAIAAAVVASIATFLAGQFAELAATAQDHRHAVVPNEPLPVWIASNLVEPLLNPFASVGIAVLFAALLLLHKDQLGERFTNLAGASRDFGRHLLFQGLLDVSFGGLIALGLWYVGVPNFGLWALLGVMLRSVPFVGVPVAALCPLMLAVSLDPTALLVCETLLVFLSVDAALLLVERKLMRKRTFRLSAFAAVGATIAWSCVWGITGLLLAIPLTLGLVMLGRQFAPLAFLDRLLAGNAVAPEPAVTRSDAAIRALAAAQRELGSPEQRERFRKAIDGTVSRLAPDVLVPADRNLALRPWNLAPGWLNDPVLCIAGPGIMDEAAAGLLAEALRRKGLTARVLSFEDTLPANLPRLDLDARVVCFSCLDALDAPVLRQLVRRVRPRSRSAKAIAGLWGWDGPSLMDAGMMECDLITTNMNEAAERIVRLAREASETLVAAAA